MKVFSLWRGMIEVPDPPDHRTKPQILADVCLRYEVAVEDVLSGSRWKPVSRARQAFMAEAYATGRWSQPQIGAFLGRDHTTVLHGLRAHARRAAA